ncbi:MAG: maleylacetoacetate isomerase [Oceanococcaceae bacterium]
MLELYTYYRSVSAHRVRIALNYKGIPYQSVYVDHDADEQFSAEFLERNPQGLVPALSVNEQLLVTQSSAILEYLEERYPERPLLPTDIQDRARVRSFAQVLIADTNPTNILRVYRYMRDEMELDHATRRRWYEHWAHKGMQAVESLLQGHLTPGKYCHGDKPTLADVCLVPQVANAEANKLDLSAYPTARRIYRTCNALSAFQSAAPLTQADRLAKSVRGS